MKISEPQKVGVGKSKQEVLLSDSTGSAMLTLWEDDINMLIEGKSYQTNRLVVKCFLGKTHLSMPPTGATIEEIDDLENVIQTASSLNDDNDEEYLQNVSVTGIQHLESVYTCINCKKAIHPTTETVAVCDICKTTQKMGNHRLTAKLFIENQCARVTLRAYHDSLTAITQRDDVKCEDLLFAAPFNVTYNKYHVITLATNVTADFSNICTFSI